MFKKEFLYFQDNLYIVKKIIKERHNPIIDVWKERLNADIVLRRDGQLYFLELVPDLEIIEETKIVNQ
jgi:radical SAM superfamily enzyme YgiQ (UPF0313 family)